MSSRDRTIIAVIAVLAVVVGGWLLLVQPKRNEAAKLGRQITAAQQQLSTAHAAAASALVDEQAYAANYAEVARLGEAVPADDDTASLIVQLQSAASRSRVDFLSLALTGSGSAAPTSTSTGAAATALDTLPPGATIGAAGFPAMPFTFTFQGNFFRLATFLGRIERFVVATNRRIAVSGRLMTLNAINFGPGAGGFPQIDASISATTYLLPTSEGLTAGATQSAPAASSPSTENTSGTGSSSSSAAPAAISAPTP